MREIERRLLREAAVVLLAVALAALTQVILLAVWYFQRRDYERGLSPSGVTAGITSGPTSAGVHPPVGVAHAADFFAGLTVVLAAAAVIQLLSSARNVWVLSLPAVLGAAVLAAVSVIAAQEGPLTVAAGSAHRLLVRPPTGMSPALVQAQWLTAALVAAVVLAGVLLILTRLVIERRGLPPGPAPERPRVRVA